jgi:hypothetical protein
MTGDAGVGFNEVKQPLAAIITGANARLNWLG